MEFLRDRRGWSFDEPGVGGVLTSPTWVGSLTSPTWVEF